MVNTIQEDAINLIILSCRCKYTNLYIGTNVPPLGRVNNSNKYFMQYFRYTRRQS